MRRQTRLVPRPSVSKRICPPASGDDLPTRDAEYSTVAAALACCGARPRTHLHRVQDPG
jgi:hypothetical protein